MSGFRVVQKRITIVFCLLYFLSFLFRDIDSCPIFNLEAPQNTGTCPSLVSGEKESMQPHHGIEPWLS